MKYYIKVVLIFFVVLFALPTIASSLKYALIIDAGSSGSRGHVFQYVTALPGVPDLPIITDLFNQSTKPGLSSYANNPTDAGASLKPVLDAAAAYLNHQGVALSQVPVSVLATAGMRLLPQSKQDAIYANVETYIRANYAYILGKQNIRTITGQQEGLFGWLDVNYLSNNFMPPYKTIGSIDMGGASTQIAFATSDTRQSKNVIALTINQMPYLVFTQSFLGLGQDQARKTMTSDASSSACYPDGYFYRIDSDSDSNSETGSFNFFSCGSIYNRIIQSYDVTQNMIPTTGVPFIAYAGIYYNYQFFNILSMPTQDALQAKIDITCYLPWTTLQMIYPNISTQFLSGFCANGAYLDDLLYHIYQLDGSQLTVTNKINGVEIDWTLGALLYHLVQ